ncbi:hypothetical protein CRUP_018346, partial [Coryphaenoides rupestris]
KGQQEAVVKPCLNRPTARAGMKPEVVVAVVIAALISSRSR